MTPRRSNASRRSPRRQKIRVKLRRSTDKRKKFDVVIQKPGGRRKLVRFGARGYSDYTKHKNPERKKRYLARHKKNEDWTIKGIETAGFWARWILWGEPTIRGSIRHLVKVKPSLQITYGRD